MDTYIQYASRTNSEKQRIKINPAVKSTFYRVDPQLSWEDIYKNSHYHHININKEKQAADISKKLLAEVTGKGRYVNESI
jgi:hypothetical protein